MAVGRKGDEQSNHSSTTGRESIPKPYIAGAKKGSWNPSNSARALSWFWWMLLTIFYS